MLLSINKVFIIEGSDLSRCLFPVFISEYHNEDVLLYSDILSGKTFSHKNIGCYINFNLIEKIGS